MQIDTSKISKTSLNGLLGLAIVAMLAIHFDSAGHLAMTAKDWIALSVSVLRAGVGVAQQDADGDSK